MEERKLGDAQWHTCGAELLAAIIAFLESPAVSTELKSRFLDSAKKGFMLCTDIAEEMPIGGRSTSESRAFGSPQRPWISTRRAQR